MQIKQVDEQLISKGYLKVYRNTYQLKNGSVYDREIVRSREAVAALVYNTTTNCYVMVRQHRAGVGAPLLEVPTGCIEKDQNPDEAMVRELEEEIGYRVSTDDLKFINKIYPTPGICSEILNLYSVIVTDENKVSEGGGLVSEDEYIEIVNILSGQFMDMYIYNNTDEVLDGKTLILALRDYLDNYA